MLDQLQGYRTKIAGIVLAVLAANEVYQFLPAQYVQAIVYLAGGAGLYFLREAIDNLKNKLTPPEPPANPPVQQFSSPSGPSDLPGKRPLPNIPSIIDETKRKIEVAGTFNPFAIGAIGASSVAERAAKATEEVAANTKELLKEVKRGGTLVFK